MMGFNVAYFYFHSGKDYPAVKHSHDIWHAANNLDKNLLMVSLEYQIQNSYDSFQFCVISLYTSMYNEIISISSLIYMIWGFFHFDERAI